MNLYSFVRNDPVNMTDRLGLEQNEPPSSASGDVDIKGSPTGGASGTSDGPPYVPARSELSIDVMGYCPATKEGDCGSVTGPANIPGPAKRCEILRNIRSGVACYQDVSCSIQCVSKCLKYTASWSTSARGTIESDYNECSGQFENGHCVIESASDACAATSSGRCNSSEN
jgi:hypothetical protein